MKKMRTKFLLILIAVAIIPMIMIGAYTIYSMIDNIENSSISANENKILLVSERMTNMLGNISSDLFYLRDSTAMKLYLSSLSANPYDEKSTHLLLQNMEQSFYNFSISRGIFKQVRFINTEGKEVARIDKIKGKTQVSPTAQLQNKKNRYYFKNTIKLPKGDLMISPLDLNREKGKVEKPYRAVIRYSTPVRDDDNNKLRGIIILNVMADELLKFVAEGSDKNKPLVFVDNAGYYYYHPDTTKAWGSERDLNTKINLFTDIPTVKKPIEDADRIKITRTAAEVITINPIKFQYTNAAKNKKGTHKLGTLLSIIPKNVISKPAHDFFYIFIGIVLLSLLITIVLSSILSRSIAQPISTLRDEVERLSKGDLDTPISIKKGDEIGDLSRAIERLRKSMRILMRRVS